MAMRLLPIRIRWELGDPGHIVSKAELFGNGSKTLVRRPESQSLDNGGREQVDIDPADPASVQAPLANENDDLVVRDHAGLPHAFVVREELVPASAVANQEFPINELMSGHFFVAEQPLEFGRIG